MDDDEEPFCLRRLVEQRQAQLVEAQAEYVERLRAVDDLRVRLVAAETELAVARNRVAGRQRIIANASACQAIARLMEAPTA